MESRQDFCRGTGLSATVNPGAGFFPLSWASATLFRGGLPSTLFPYPTPLRCTHLHDQILSKSFLQDKSLERHYFIAVSPMFSNISISVAKKKYHCLNPIVLNQGRFPSSNPGTGNVLVTFLVVITWNGGGGTLLTSSE